MRYALSDTSIYENLVKELRETPGQFGDRVRQNLDSIAVRRLAHSNYDELATIASILGGETVADTVGDLSVSELARFKYAPICSTDVERTFSVLKHILGDRRQNFTFENLRMIVVIHCNE